MVDLSSKESIEKATVQVSVLCGKHLLLCASSTALAACAVLMVWLHKWQQLGFQTCNRGSFS
eukprot:1159986-Pelagomonas_calceolata.AAC.4